MKKYWLTIKNEYQRQLIYRADTASYLGANFCELFTQVIIWGAIFKQTNIIKGYTYNDMIVYVVIGWIFMFVTSNYQFERVISKDIQQGTLSNFITKPISYLRYITAVSFGRGSVAFIVIIFSIVGCLLFFKDYLFSNFSLVILFLLLIMLIFSYFIKLFISFLVGTIAFWVIDVSGIYNCLGILIAFLSGAYFPANLLPEIFVKISLFFPFIYVFYIPTQLYLGKISIVQGLQGIGVQFIWLLLLYFIIKMVWKKGLKKYESVGA